MGFYHLTPKKRILKMRHLRLKSNKNDIFSSNEYEINNEILKNEVLIT